MKKRITLHHQSTTYVQIPIEDWNYVKEQLMKIEKFIEKNEPHDGYLTRSAAAKYLGCSTTTISDYAREGIITRYYPNGQKNPRFKKHELDAIMIPQRTY